MAKFLTLKTLGLSVMLAAGGIAPVTAAPMMTAPSIPQAQSDVLQVRDGVQWYRGYRGYHSYRPGYRYHNGWWFPGGAFVAGALIGGALANNYYEPYYGNGYYDDYAPEPYYVRRPYEVAPGYGYRQGYRDGYRAGRSNRYVYGYPCSPRLADSGRCY